MQSVNSVWDASGGQRRVADMRQLGYTRPDWLLSTSLSAVDSEATRPFFHHTENGGRTENSATVAMSVCVCFANMC